LPGIGSYVAAAIQAEDFRAIGWAILTMILMIVIIDQLVWKPLVTIADRYKMELSAGEERRSWLVNVGRSASLPRYAGRILRPVSDMLDRALSSATGISARTQRGEPSRLVDRVFNITLILVAVSTVAYLSHYVISEVSFGEVWHVIKLGFVTGARVVVLLIVSTLVWTPIAVAIGFSPRLTKICQPVVQILASFPANFLFPFATLAFIKTGVSINWGSILLMALGAQWYILFNVIGGAQAIPNDLREMAVSVGLRGGRAWRALIGPGIFGTWVTGAITASGGAWNASIVSELVSWGDTHLRAYGLGSYIEEATRNGDWPRIALGVGMMSIFVVALNRAVWSPLYRLAESKYRLD
jgi:NitT/TauT family transport system permease protein